MNNRYREGISERENPLSDDELRHILGSVLDEDGFMPTCLNYKKALEKARKATTAEEAYVLSGLHPVNA